MASDTLAWTCMAEPGSDNPKHALGKAKAPFDFTPPSALAWLGYVMWYGAIHKEYGPFNFVKTHVAWSVYYNAIQRHVNAIQAGEWLDPESGAPHIAHIMGCAAVVIDAHETGKLVRDEPAGVTAPLGPVMNKITALMRQKHVEKEQEKK